MDHLGAAVLYALHPHPLLVHSQRDTLGSVEGIYLARLGISGLLQAKDLVPSQKLHNQVVEILGTSPYHHLLRGHVNAPELAQIAHNGLTQFGHSAVG